MSSIVNKMDSNLTGLWVSFFTAAGIPSQVAAIYALTFAENRIQNDMLLDLNKEYLRDMGITRMGDIIAILRHAKQVHENTARDRVLNTAVAAKVPVAAVTGRTTVAQPSSPASRILEHYTRNNQETSPVRSSQQKRKSSDNTNEDLNIKKSRLIRFGTPPETSILTDKQGPQNKTVFSRLGNSDAVKQVVAKPVLKPAPQKQGKQVFSRLGGKNSLSDGEQTMPIQKDALKYEGILKSTSPPVAKKVFTVTTSSNGRKIAVGCTMRADETPVSIKDKLALKSKSVKFSNRVEYKEIEAIKKKPVRPKFTPVFNKPERRLSMGDIGTAGVKARLGNKNQTQQFTTQRNIFTRLGV